uniref:Uncharacterized protein n=1 Tax=Physcomitrium patens TaxID=3218 RepID=A0A2K1KIP1_PHYPA|nr:hypothetical protein PHYPA_007313 [Physcomitrium patens]
MENFIGRLLSQNYAKFLIKKSKKCIYISKDMAATKEHFLKDQMVFVTFIDSKLILSIFLKWLTKLLPCKEVAQHILILTLYKFRGVMSIFQTWIFYFYSNTHQGMMVHT